MGDGRGRPRRGLRHRERTHPCGGRGSGHRRQGETEHRQERQQSPKGDQERHSGTMPAFRSGRKASVKGDGASHVWKVKVPFGRAADPPTDLAGWASRGPVPRRARRTVRWRGPPRVPWRRRPAARGRIEAAMEAASTPSVPWYPLGTVERPSSERAMWKAADGGSGRVRRRREPVVILGLSRWPPIARAQGPAPRPPRARCPGIWETHRILGPVRGGRSWAVRQTPPRTTPIGRSGGSDRAGGSEVSGGGRRPTGGRAAGHRDDRSGRQAEVRSFDLRRCGPLRSMRLGQKTGWDVVHPPREGVTRQSGEHGDSCEGGHDLAFHGGTL